MDALITGLDKLTTDEITAQLEFRLNAMNEEDREDISDSVLEMLDDINDNATALTPLYKIMNFIPDVYFRDSADTGDLIIGIGKTIEVLLLVNRMA
jgi:adenine C2-methylase RlmN of 23S rRNA A2503 and tRNA A37